MNAPGPKDLAVRAPRFSVQIPQQDIPYPELVDIALEAEDLGYDSVWVFDHFFPIIGSPEGPCMDGWTVLAALAALTQRVRLGVLVSGVTYRHPSVLAKMATTIDIISGGRLDFGLGGAWFDLEHRALGIPFPGIRERLERLEEALQLTRLLWTRGTEGKVDFEGKHYQLREAPCNPAPVQKPHPPIMVGGGGEKRTLRSVARHANLWNTFGTPEVLRRKLSILREHCEAEGRNPDDIESSVLLATYLSEDSRSVERVVKETAAKMGRSEEEARQAMLVGDPDAVTDRIREYHDAGVTHIFFGCVPVWDRPSLRRFAAEVIPRFRDT